MKAKTIRHAIEVRIFAFALLATFAFAAAANAQTLSARFTLPFEVQWGKSVLPAGEYTINMDSTTNVVLFRSVDGKTAGFTPMAIKDDSTKGPQALIVLIHGNQRTVRSINLPEQGVSLIYSPSTSAQREMLAKADHIQAVPVTTARK